MRFLAAAVCCLFIGAAAQAGTLEDRDFSPQRYHDSDHRDFYVYVPDAYDGSQALPMVMVLHGCRQDRDTIVSEFGWDELADQQGFILVAPDISTSDLGRFSNCWGYWEDDEIHQGGGEVEDLRHIGMQVERQWRTTNIGPRPESIPGAATMRMPRPTRAIAKTPGKPPAHSNPRQPSLQACALK